MTPQELSIRLAEPSNIDNLYIVDVRNLKEWQYNRLPFAHHHPLDNFTQIINFLPQSVEIVVYCHHGVRSQYACELLNASGFDKVCNLEGGIHAWAMQIDPSVGTY